MKVRPWFLAAGQRLKKAFELWPEPAEQLTYHFGPIFPKRPHDLASGGSFYQALRINTNTALTLWLHLDRGTGEPSWSVDWEQRKTDFRYVNMKVPFPSDAAEAYLRELEGFDLLRAQLEVAALEAAAEDLRTLLDRYYKPSEEQRFRTRTQWDELAEKIERAAAEASTLDEQGYWHFYFQRSRARAKAKKAAVKKTVDGASATM